MRFVSIASGSSGNCIYIGSERTHILVDAGISNKRIEQGLNAIGLKGSDLNGVVITHEHSDHIKGIGVMQPGKLWRKLQQSLLLENIPRSFFILFLQMWNFLLEIWRFLPFPLIMTRQIRWLIG